MLTSLANIQDPWLRSLTAAATTFSAVTMASAITIAAQPNLKSAHEWGVKAALFAAGGGAALGLVYSSRRTPKPLATAAMTDPQGAESTAWQGWRNFIVVRKIEESAEITSFYLKPHDGQPIPNFQPGQFLTIKLDIPGQTKPVIRTYSLSDYAETCEYYRLSIKREPAPKDLDVPAGVASNYMHDHVQVGTLIPAKPPSGKFCLDIQPSTPVVLVSNGVGITPMIAMARAASLLNPSRPIWFIHGARDGQTHAFRQEISDLAQQQPNLKVHVAYSRPRPEDLGVYQSRGYADIELLKTLVDPDAEFFLCGSPPFLQALIAGLNAWGVASDRIRFEAFGQRMNPSSPPTPAPQAATGENTEARVTFAKAGQTLTWHEQDGSLLEFAEAHGFNPDYSCRQGICGTCTCKIQAGEVDYLAPPPR
jgi:uncharacterized protein